MGWWLTDWKKKFNTLNLKSLMKGLGPMYAFKTKWWKNNQSGWRCQLVRSYENKHMTAATFSSDGSVFVVAADSVITLWDPGNNTLGGEIAKALFSGDGDRTSSICRGRAT